MQMQLFIGYSAVVFIWATTPLAVHWSNTSVNFASAVAMRVIGAAVIGLIILWASRQRLIQNKGDWLAFIAGSLSLFPTALLVYWAAQFVPSGLMSVIFGFFPFIVAAWSYLFASTSGFGIRQWLAVVMALAGLILLNFDYVGMEEGAVLGICALLMATNFWAFSSVWMKSLPQLPPFRQSVGSAVVASPFFVVAILLSDETPSFESLANIKSATGIVYLTVFGSLVGHTLFFYVLSQCQVQTVSLIPLMTPVLALMLGWLIEGDKLTVLSITGVFVILLALAIFQGVFRSSALSWLVRRSFRSIPADRTKIAAPDTALLDEPR